MRHKILSRYLWVQLWVCIIMQIQSLKELAPSFSCKKFITPLSSNIIPKLFNFLSIMITLLQQCVSSFFCAYKSFAIMTWLSYWSQVWWNQSYSGQQIFESQQSTFGELFHSNLLFSKFAFLFSFIYKF